MLGRIRNAVTSRFDSSVYPGPLAALAPIDLGLSLLAKRSYAMYRVWDRYQARTGSYFDRASLPEAESYDPASLDVTALTELRTRGFALLQSPFDEAEVERTQQIVLAECERIKAEGLARDPAAPRLKWSEGHMSYELDRLGGRTRLYFTREALEHPSTPPLIRAFVGVASARALACAYLGAGSVVVGQPYTMAEMLEPAPQLETWHVDCLRATVKCFLTLSDVDERSAPLRYVPASNQVDEARRDLFFRIANGGLGHAYFDQVDCDRFDRLGVPVMVPRNRLIVFDNRGVHAGSKATPPSRRFVLATGFRPVAGLRMNPRLFKDPAPMPYPWERGALEK